MLKITFKYADAMSGWKWREQTCVCNSVKECKEFYGLGIDCEYEIIKIEEVLDMTEYKFLKRLEELNFHIINVEEIVTGHKGIAKSCSAPNQSHAVCVTMNGQDKIVNWNFFNSDYRIYGCSKG